MVGREGRGGEERDKEGAGILRIGLTDAADRERGGGVGKGWRESGILWRQWKGLRDVSIDTLGVFGTLGKLCLT